MAKIDPETKEIVDYLLSQVEYEISDEDDGAAMAKIMHLKMLDASAKILAAQKSKEQAEQSKRLADNVAEMYHSHIVESNNLMRQALMIFSRQLDNGDGREEILELAKQMAGKESHTSVNTFGGDNVTKGDQSFGDMKK